MKKILNVITSPRGKASFSTQLGSAIIDKIVTENPGSTVRTRNLSETLYPHIEMLHLEGFFTPPAQHGETHKQALQLSNEAVHEILDADIIVINTPMWNFSVPSVLKAWIDNIVRAGLTFSYSEKGAAGLVKGKKAYIALATGNFYSQGEAKAKDFVEPYLKTVLGLIGITDVSTFRVEGTSLPGIQDTALEKAVNTIVL